MSKHTWKKISSAIWLLTFNDIFTWGVMFVFTILMGLYLDKSIEGNITEVIGVGAGISYLVRGISQIPLGMMGDQLKTDRDELAILMIGNALMGTSVILITLIDQIWQFYLLQGLFGLGASKNVVNWRKVFAKSLDQGIEGLEYGVYDTAMSFSIAIMSIFSASIASISDESFTSVILTIGILIIASNVWVLPLASMQKKSILGKFDGL